METVRRDAGEGKGEQRSEERHKGTEAREGRSAEKKGACTRQSETESYPAAICKSASKGEVKALHLQLTSGSLGFGSGLRVGLGYLRPRGLLPPPLFDATGEPGLPVGTGVPTDACKFAKLLTASECAGEKGGGGGSGLLRGLLLAPRGIASGPERG